MPLNQVKDDGRQKRPLHQKKSKEEIKAAKKEEKRLNRSLISVPAQMFGISSAQTTDGVFYRSPGIYIKVYRLKDVVPHDTDFLTDLQKAFEFAKSGIKARITSTYQPGFDGQMQAYRFLTLELGAKGYAAAASDYNDVEATIKRYIIPCGIDDVISVICGAAHQKNIFKASETLRRRREWKNLIFGEFRQGENRAIFEANDTKFRQINSSALPEWAEEMDGLERLTQIAGVTIILSVDPAESDVVQSYQRSIELKNNRSIIDPAETVAVDFKILLAADTTEIVSMASQTAEKISSSAGLTVYDNISEAGILSSITLGLVDDHDYHVCSYEVLTDLFI